MVDLAVAPPSADRLIRGVGASGEIRVVAVTTTQVLQEARRKHSMTAIATAALGRAMGASLLLASSMKEAQARVNIRVSGDGQLGLIFADAGQDGTTRGFVHNPQLDNIWAEGDLDIRSAVGFGGFLRVMRDIGYGEPYSSTVELVSGEIGADVSWYLASSEQTLSKLIVGECLHGDAITQAGGILVQVMPQSATNERLMRQIDERIPDSAAFGRSLSQGKTVESVLHELLHDLDLVILPASKVVRFQCRCSMERMLGAIKILGEAELRDMILKDEGAEAVCHFCSQVYRADRQQLESLLAELQSRHPPDADPTARDL
jgi:molecular chaperone Hsp33